MFFSKPYPCRHKNGINILFHTVVGCQIWTPSESEGTKHGQAIHVPRLCIIMHMAFIHGRLYTNNINTTLSGETHEWHDIYNKNSMKLKIQ